MVVKSTITLNKLTYSSAKLILIVIHSKQESMLQSVHCCPMGNEKQILTFKALSVAITTCKVFAGNTWVELPPYNDPSCEVLAG
jgi:hypothetical protein